MRRRTPCRSPSTRRFCATCGSTAILLRKILRLGIPVGDRNGGVFAGRTGAARPRQRLRLGRHRGLRRGQPGGELRPVSGNVDRHHRLDLRRAGDRPRGRRPARLHHPNRTSDEPRDHRGAGRARLSVLTRHHGLLHSTRRCSNWRSDCSTSRCGVRCSFGMATVFSGAMRASGTVWMPLSISIFAVAAIEVPLRDLPQPRHRHRTASGSPIR